MNGTGEQKMANEKRLIDANAFIEEHCADCKYFNVNGICTKEDPVCGSVMIVTELPTVDTVEVVHGRCKKSDYMDEWYTYYYTCLECGATMMVADADYHDVSPNYCPNCGAKMDGGKVDG